MVLSTPSMRSMTSFTNEAAGIFRWFSWETVKPVVAFDLTETRFSAQDSALYATPNLVEDFANKIEVLLDNEELRLRMGAVGRKRIEEELSWDHSKEHLLLAYEMLFSRGS